jgi:hypothetical protein
MFYRALNTSEDLLSFARDEANAGQMRNALVAWNAFAGKFDRTHSLHAARAHRTQCSRVSLFV